MQTVIFGEKKKKAIVPNGWYILRKGQKVEVKKDMSLDHSNKKFTSFTPLEIAEIDSAFSDEFDCVIRELSDSDASLDDRYGKIYGYKSDVIYIVNCDGTKEVTIEKNGTKTTQYIK